VTSGALQSRQLIGMSQWCSSALCGHLLPALTDNWTHGAASRHTIAPISMHAQITLFITWVQPCNSLFRERERERGVDYGLYYGIGLLRDSRHVPTGLDRLRQHGHHLFSICRQRSTYTLLQRLHTANQPSWLAGAVMKWCTMYTWAAVCSLITYHCTAIGSCAQSYSLCFSVLVPQTNSLSAAVSLRRHNTASQCFRSSSGQATTDRGS